MNYPKTAYVLLWFPKPSETFIFREITNLRAMGLDCQVFTLYGRITRGLSKDMREESDRVERLGRSYLKSAPREWLYWRRRDRRLVKRVFRHTLARRWRGLEKTGENFWAFTAGFYLARRFEEKKIEHIHAPWAGGPAMAAWVASLLTGIPFSFTARAWDIYPPDGALEAKIRDAAFVRTGTAHNLDYLIRMTGERAGKIILTYNGVSSRDLPGAEVKMIRPLNLLALGRLVGKKGYDDLLRASKILEESGLEFNLVIAGDGPEGKKLKQLAGNLGLTKQVSFPGFVNYDRVPELFQASDIFIMPSVVHSSGDRDGIPNVIMESLLHGVPVIATDISGIPELIIDGETGLLVPEKDPAALAKAVIMMAADRNEAVRMADRGRKRVRELFDPMKNYRIVLDLFQQYRRPQNSAGKKSP